MNEEEKVVEIKEEGWEEEVVKDEEEEVKGEVEEEAEVWEVEYKGSRWRRRRR